MDDWFEKYAEALEERLGSWEPTVASPRRSENPILRLARIVPHGTERKNVPPAANVAGLCDVARGTHGLARRRLLPR